MQEVLLPQHILSRDSLDPARKNREFSASGPVKFSRINNNSSYGSTVTADELRRRMHNNIGSKLKRPDKIRSTKGIVNNKRYTVLMGNFCDRLNINYVNSGVSKRLNIKSLCLFINGFSEIFRIVRVYKNSLIPILGKVAAKRLYVPP